MMIGKGPYANQFGVLMPVIAVNIPGTPPTSEFLKKLFHARARVHDGMIYGMMKRVVMIFFHFISVLIASHANIPPTPIATTHEPRAQTRECARGWTNVV